VPVQSTLTGHSLPLSFGLIPRVLVLAAVFAVELLVLSIWLDNAALVSRAGILGLVGRSGAWAVRGIVGFAAIFFTFAYLKSSAALGDLSRQVEGTPVGRGFLAAHFLAMGVFGSISWALYGDHLGGFPADLATTLWLITGCGGIAFAAFAMIPLAMWLAVVRATGALWVYSSLAVAAACVVGAYSRSFWNPLVDLTFALVKAFLSLFVSHIVANPATANLGTPRFSVEIAPECSGFEGAGLILAFGIVWLWFFRKECRFPQALLLLPAGVVAIFLLNAVRLTALILIGDAGAPQIALGGFHSQAGWIAFNIVALGLAVAARRLAWFSNAPASALPADDQLAAMEQPAAADSASDNPAATYLIPFLSILFVGMLSTAVSADFEWLYPLRFVAVVGVLWIFRARYASLDWKFGWFGPTMGVAVFAIWMGADWLLRIGTAGTLTTGDAMPGALAAASVTARITWIAFRVLAATVTVPIAEELAFRGFLIRRFISPDIEALPASSYTWLGLGISSVAFGLMHGHMWVAGILAGLFYAWALIRRSRIGEAVIAHATTNALLAAYVLLFQKWHLW
jgi:exosortase E/protease (VPEID-CTERM system)